MYNSVVRTVLLCTVFVTGILAQAATTAPAVNLTLTPEQMTAMTADPQCVDYYKTANLSIIGGNSTYRSAFLQLSPIGTLYNKRLLDAAVVKELPLRFDAALNTKCGNASAIALDGAATNFTMGVVAQFSGLVGNPQFVQAGPEVLIICGSLFFILMFYLKVL